MLKLKYKDSEQVLDRAEKRRVRAFELRKVGIRNKDIAVELGVSRSAITQIFKRYEGDLRLKKHPETAIVALVYEILEAKGWTNQELAQQVGVGEITVAKWLAGEREPRERSKQKLAALYSRETSEKEA